MKQKTSMRQLIELLEETKKTKCSTLKEVMFFDGVLALIDGFNFESINEQEIKKAWTDGASTLSAKNATLYFSDTFEKLTNETQS